jgi:hypothetical protein
MVVVYSQLFTEKEHRHNCKKCCKDQVHCDGTPEVVLFITEKETTPQKREKRQNKEDRISVVVRIVIDKKSQKEG